MTPDIMQQFPAITIRLRNGQEGIIQPLTPEFGEALATFYAEVPREDIRFYDPHPLNREFALGNAERACGPCEVVLVCMLPDAKIGGYAWYRWKPDAPVSDFGICIAPKCQRQGLGRMLMTRLMEIAKVIGPPVMSLTVQLANARAVALYRSMGFEVVREQMLGPRHEFAAEPEYYMEHAVR